MAFAKFKVKTGLAVKPENTSNSAGELIPVGLIIPWVGNTAPDGWLLCNGQSITDSNYKDLVTVLGGTTSATIPDLSGCVVIGVGQGSGKDSSGTGFIPIVTSPAPNALTNRSLGLAQPTSSHPPVSITHTHGLASHTHPTAHTHNYPHSHSVVHSHTAIHAHTMPTPSGAHTHAGYFSVQYSTGPGNALRTTGSTGNGAEDDGVHGHPLVAATAPASSGSGSPFATSATVPSWPASPVNTSSPERDPAGSPIVTGSLGGSTPSGDFSVSQPVITINYIIKY